eukprot:TCONS_00069782-protein
MQDNYFGHHNMQTKLPDTMGQNYGNLYSLNKTTSATVKTPIRPITKLPTTCTTNTHPKKSRTVFTKKQINELESVFYQKRYLTIKDREELSRRLTLTENQVKVWFQNRRNKWKREMSFKVEFAKFNMVPNPLNMGRGVDGTLPNNLMLPTTTTSPTETSDFQMTSHRYEGYAYRNAFQDSYYNPYPNVFNNQDTQNQHNYSPLSNSSSNNEVSYQDNNTSMPQTSVALETYDTNSIVYPPPPPPPPAQPPQQSVAQNMTDYQNQQHHAIYSHYNNCDTQYDTTKYQGMDQQIPSSYDIHNYSPTGQTSSYTSHRYTDEATQPQTDPITSQISPLVAKYTDEQQQASPYEACKYTEHNQQTTSYTPRLTPMVPTTSGREMYTDNTGVVYTTLTDYRNSSENQTLNLPNPQFTFGSHY